MAASLKRRNFLTAAAVLFVLGYTRQASANALYGGDDEEYFDPALLPPAESEVDFPIEQVNPRLIKKRFRRQIVDFEGAEALRTIIVDPGNRFLYYVIEQGQAI